MAEVFVTGAAQLPWDKIYSLSATAASAVGTARAFSPPAPEEAQASDAVPAKPSRPEPDIYKPGCTAADKAVLTQGYLDSLARGNEGFGVLRLGKKYLNEGARAAEHARHPALATDMRRIADELPSVKTVDQARAAAERLRPVSDRAWSLGVACGRYNRPMPPSRLSSPASPED